MACFTCAHSPVGTTQAHAREAGRVSLCAQQESHAGPSPWPVTASQPVAVPAAAVCSHPQRCLTDDLRVLQDKSLYHPVSGSCMDCSESDHRIFMNICNPSSPTQQWLFEHTNSTVLEKFNSN